MADTKQHGKLVEERQFAGLLQTQAETFYRLSNTLLADQAAEDEWTRRHYFQLISESDVLETFLDDYGARYNRTYAYFTELVASLRWFAYAGYSVSHLLSRMDSYGDGIWGDGSKEGAVVLQEGHVFLRATAIRILMALRAESQKLGVEITPDRFPEQHFVPVAARRQLPRNVGQAELANEEQKIAEVATKFVQAAQMVSEIGSRRYQDKEELHTFFSASCTEETARVYEATVHNLQSTYDTHIKNTVLEGRDSRLPRLRGHTSAALHLLEAFTYLAHFIERHETELRSEEAERRIFDLIDRCEVERVALNGFLFWSNCILRNGVELAEDLLSEYTNLQELAVELPSHLALHARPAALVVGIVNHHGTPVEMELEGRRCNAGSILELLVAVGSNPNHKRFVFTGDVRPLHDIKLLFENGLGEGGMDRLPARLNYLRA